MSTPQPGTLDYAARLAPEAEALVEGKRRLRWKDWEERACRLARFLQARLGIEARDRVAWMLPNGIEVFELAFALQKLGAVGVPVGYRLTGAEAAYIVDDSDAKAVVCHARFAGRLAGALGAMPRVPEDRFVVVGPDTERGGALRKATAYEEALASAPASPLTSEAPQQGGSIIYTSGTTGRPKGAYRDGADPAMQEALREFLIGVVQGFGYEPGDRHLVTCPLYHSAPPALAGITHLLGGTVVVCPRFDAEDTLRRIEEERITSAFMVPTQLNRITALPEAVRARYDLSSMKRLIVGAAPFPFPLKRKVVELFPNPCLYEFYGSTETAINTILRPEDQLRKPGSCGRPCPGNELRILDEEGREVPPGEIGILYVRNPLLITGYHKRREATEECLRDGFFTVGDMARVDEEGFVSIVDRQKDMIISGGVNIYPAEIEQELRQHPGVYDCAVIGVPNEEWGEEVKAVVQMAEGARASEEELSAFLADRLADYKRPRSIDFVDELPYNPSGKLLKKELRQRYWTQSGRAV